MDIEKSPVAIKLVSEEAEIPNVPKIKENLRHCEMVQRAIDGQIFYATVNEQQVCNSAGALGLMDPLKKVISGEMHYSMGKFSSIESAKRTVNAIPRVDTIIKAVVYSPLEKTPYKPDVIIIICNPEQAMKLTQTLLYNSGGRLEANFAGIQSVCGDAVAGPYTTNRPNITLGCDASRKFADIQPHEVIVGINNAYAGDILNI